MRRRFRFTRQPAGASVRSRPVAVAAGLAVALAACSAAGSDRGDIAARPASAGAGTSGSLSTADPSTPTAAATTTPTRPAATVTLAFGGDVHFEGVDRARLAADPATAIGPVSGLLRRADLAMVNLETAVTTRGAPAPKRYVFQAPPSAFTALRSAGIDVVTLANNHGMDYGLTGLRDSLAAARAARFPVVGIGEDDDAAFAPWITTFAGERIAVIGATQVLDANLISAWTAAPGKPGLASTKDESRLLRAVREARSRADVVVVYLHWGTEMATCPTSVQRSLAEALAQAGADVVVGSHAHVLLGAGKLRSTYVSYGLGNFVFYARSGPTLESGVLMLTLHGRDVRSARWSPARISGGIPIPLTGDSASAAVRDWERLRACTGLAAVPAS